MHSTSAFFLAAPILLAHACPISNRPADSPFPIRLTSLLASQQGCASASICSARDFRWIYGAFFPARKRAQRPFSLPPCHGPSRSLTHAASPAPRASQMPWYQMQPGAHGGPASFPLCPCTPSIAFACTNDTPAARCMGDLLRLYGSFLRTDSSLKFGGLPV
jgi:hypothetical protein